MNLTPEKMLTLFFHRSDVFAEQKKGGWYCPVKRPATLEDVKRHLKGEITMGAYCLKQDNTVKWGCIDLDGTDQPLLKKQAELIYKTFDDLPKILMLGRLLENSGRRGFHVWIFFRYPIQALLAKAIIKSRLNNLNLPLFEVFPKQTELNENRKYGNLVKVPKGKHLKSGKWSEIIKGEIDGI